MDDDLAVDLERIADPALRRLIGRLLNRIEDVQAENAALREENQRLRDEVALPKSPASPGLRRLPAR